MDAADLEKVRARVGTDTPFYARHCLWIVDKSANLVRFEPNEPQLRLERALEAQRAAGQPQRAIVLKSRKVGISTYVQAKILQRVTQRRFRKALVVGQDGDTAGELFEIGERMYGNLPEIAGLELKPPIRHQRKQRELVFGETSRAARHRGDVGIESSLKVDTANEVEAGRGFTYTELHLSEVAFWKDVKKMIALLNAVPDDPSTLIVKESTANGENFFKEDWDAAEAGESEYVPVFIGWQDDPTATRRFANAADREAFVATIGDVEQIGEPAKEELDLIRLYGVTPEQLYWRRETIANKTRGSIDTFHQEYPSNPEEAFLSSGRLVFDRVQLARFREHTELTDPRMPETGQGPDVGVFLPAGIRAQKSRHGTTDVPTGSLWVPREKTGHPAHHPFWRVWEQPATDEWMPDDVTDEEAEKFKAAARYVVAIDPAGDEAVGNESAYHAIRVVNHRTLKDVALYRSRVDPDLIALEALYAALHFNDAIIAVEITGGYGLSMARKLHTDYRYRRVYRRRAQQSKDESETSRLGWSTDRGTKPLLEDEAKELLRQACDPAASVSMDVLRSRETVGEFFTYVKDEKGRTGPSAGKHSDLMLAWMIAQHIAREQRPPPVRLGPLPTSTTRAVRDPRLGY